MKTTGKAAQAWRLAKAAAQDGNKAAEIQWLERAARLAPNDPRVLFGLANARLTAGAAAAAAAAFAQVLSRHDYFPAWLGLIAARHLTGEHQAAAAAFDDAMSRHCQPGQPGFARLADMVARAAGAAGWCAVAPDGTLLAAAIGKAPKFRLNGATVTLRRHGAGFELPENGVLEVKQSGGRLLGNRLDLAALRRVAGIVEAKMGGLTGWASRLAAPGLPPDLRLADAQGFSLPVACGGALPADESAPFLIRHRFNVPAKRLAGLTPPFQILAPDGAAIAGGPVHPGAELAIKSVAAAKMGRQVTTLPRRRRLAVVVPAYRGFAETRACLESLYAARPAEAVVIVVDDASPEPELRRWLTAEADAGRITLHRHEVNQGFPAAANTGIRAAANRDVLLLNSDTLVPPGAIETLRQVAYAKAETGSVTPLSNQATILSYPRTDAANPAPDLAGTIALNALAARANGLRAVSIPTGVGFCMYLRHDCLRATGLFRAEIFAQGYGEENDWCLRARHAGYRHVAATGAYVAHTGGVSFRAAGRALMARNARLLNRLYPGYHAMIMDFIAADRLTVDRKRLDILRFAAGGLETGAVLLVSHQHGGGVARQVAADMAAIRTAGQRPILLFPAAPAEVDKTPFPWDAELTDGKPGDYPNLRFTLPAAWPALLRLLRGAKIGRVIFHHGLGAHPLVRQVAAALGVRQDIVIHDYASFCPRVNLLTRDSRRARPHYCGEPALPGCIACVRVAGDETFENLGVKRLLARSALELSAAARVIAPSADAARRVARHFSDIRPEVTPWEDDSLPLRLKPPAQGRRKIVIIGGIGPAKGFDMIMDCARDATGRGLPLEFIVAGASAADEKLIEAGIFVTGAYAEGEAVALINGLAADLAFLPSIWPETWCFALGEAWRAGLYAISFDLGAQAARIRATGRGGTLPLGLPAARINDSLLAWQPHLPKSPLSDKTLFD